MSTAKATAFRKIVRSRLKFADVTLVAACPDWSTDHDSSLRRLKRVLKDGAPLAYEDAWDLLSHLARLQPASGKMLFWHPADYDFPPDFSNKAEVKTYLDKAKEHRVTMAAHTQALKLLAPKYTSPAMAIFPGETRNLVKLIERVIAKATRLSADDRSQLAKEIGKHLIPYEMQMTENERCIKTLEFVSKKFGSDDYRFFFLGIVKNDPSGRSQRKVSGNPWRSIRGQSQL